MIFRFLLVLILATAVCATAAQSPAKILKAAEKALGGRAAISTIKSVKGRGTVRRLSDGSTGNYHVFYSSPNLIHISMDIAGFGWEWGSNGRSVWARDSRDGLRTLTGSVSSDFQALAAFRNSLWLTAKKDKSKLSSGGTAIVGTSPANIVIMTTARGIPIKMYFDAVTNLPVKEEIPFGDVPLVTEFGNFKKVGGILYAFSQKTNLGGEVSEITFDAVEINTRPASGEFDFPTDAGAPLPDIRSLLTELRANEDRVDELLDTYSYVQKSTSRELGKDGVMRETGSETFQLSFYKGERIRRLIEKNGKPLNAKDQANADSDAQKRVEEIEKRERRDSERTGSSSAGGAPAENGRRISTAEVLRASKLINPRRERFRGRDMIVFDFEPDPSFDYKNAKSMIKFFGKTAGVVWIDEKDKQVVRLEAVLADSFKVGGGVLAKLRKGASFVLEQERVNDEIWLPSQADINLSIRVLLVKGIEVNQLVRSYDYRKFQTEVRGASVDNKPGP